MPGAPSFLCSLAFFQSGLEFARYGLGLLGFRTVADLGCWLRASLLFRVGCGWVAGTESTWRTAGIITAIARCSRRPARRRSLHWPNALERPRRLNRNNLNRMLRHSSHAVIFFARHRVVIQISGTLRGDAGQALPNVRAAAPHIQVRKGATNSGHGK